MSEISSSQRVLLLRELNGELKWFSNGDVKIWIRVFWKMCTNGKYVGEIKNREPSGSGTLTLSNGGKYLGEWKEGKEHGQGTFTFHDGRKYVGEWKNGKAWNVTKYDKNGNIKGKIVNGKEQEAAPVPEAVIIESG